MNFSQEDRKQVALFFSSILSTYYKKPVHYELVRGHLTSKKAPEVVRQYILKKCKGDELLNYFRKRKNYYEVEGTLVSLRKEKLTRPENPSDVKTKVPKPVKFVRNKSESISSSASENVNAPAKHSNGAENSEHEGYVYKHFTRLLDGGKEIDIENINFEELPKKVRHYITVNCEKSLLNYFDKFQDSFCIKEKRVSLSEKVKDYCNRTCDTETVTIGNVENVSIDPEKAKAITWLMSIEFFHGVLKKMKGKPLHVDKLASHLTQANANVRMFVQSYKPFLDYFMLSPALFCVTPELTISLSKYFYGVLNQFRNKIYDSSIESQLGTDMTLMSCLQDLVKGQDLSMDVVEDDVSSLDDEEEFWKSGTNGHWDDEYESEENESWDNRIYDDDIYSDEDVENCLEEDYRVEPYNEEIDYTNFADETCPGNFEDPTSCMTPSDPDDLSCKDTIDQLPEVSSKNELQSFTNETEEIESLKNHLIEENSENDAKLKVLFKVQLFCVEAVENKNDYILSHEIKCIKFFMQYLKNVTGGITITSLQGALGQAKSDVTLFMKNMYKGNKFPSFFQQHNEFIIKSSVVTTASNCDEIFKNRLLSFRNYKKAFSYETLYESYEYKNLLRETSSLVCGVSKRLKNNKLKCSRIYNSLAHEFPAFSESIKVNGSNLDEETERFFKILDIFEISEGLISFSSENNPIFTKWLQEVSENSFSSNLNFSSEDETIVEDTHASLSIGDKKACFRLLCEIFDCLIKDDSLGVNFSHYWEVVDILPSEMLFKVASARTDSRIIIEAFLEKAEKIDKLTDSFINEYLDDEASQKDVKSLESASVILNETKKNEKTQEIPTRLTHDTDEIMDEVSNQVQCTDANEKNNDEKDYCSENDSIYENNASHGDSPLTLNQQNSLGSEICDIEKEGFADSKISINPSCDEGLINEGRYNSPSTSSTSDQELNLNEINNFDQYKSSENLIGLDHQNQFSSENDLSNSVPSRYSAEKIAANDNEEYNSDGSENTNDKLQIIVKESDSSNVSDQDSESNHDLSELNVITDIKSPSKYFESEPNEENLSGQLDIVDPNHSESKSSTHFENRKFVEKKDYFRDRDMESEDLKNADSEINNFKFKLNESEFVNGCENKSNVESSVGHLHTINSEAKSGLSMKIKALEIESKELISNMSTCDNICVSSLSSKSYSERDFTNASKIETSCDINGIEENNDINSLKSPYPSKKESIGNEMDQKNLCKVSKDDKKDIKSKILQPIEARIVLLTADSCIAQVVLSKQTVYFLKCVFSCDGEHCCSDCFDILKIGDLVSCFVPIPELSRKVWIPIMVSKDCSQNFNGTDQMNDVLQNQIVDGACRKCEVGYQFPFKNIPLSENVSVQTEHLSIEDVGCQTELDTSEAHCQTDLSGEANRNEVMCQTEPVSLKNVLVQVHCDTIHSFCQTDMSFFNTKNKESLTDLIGSVKKCATGIISNCQTNISGEIKEIIPVDNKESQTIATGPVFSQGFYHL